MPCTRPTCSAVPLGVNATFGSIEPRSGSSGRRASYQENPPSNVAYVLLTYPPCGNVKVIAVATRLSGSRGLAATADSTWETSPSRVTRTFGPTAMRTGPRDWSKATALAASKTAESDLCMGTDRFSERSPKDANDNMKPALRGALTVAGEEFQLFDQFFLQLSHHRQIEVAASAARALHFT